MEMTSLHAIEQLLVNNFQFCNNPALLFVKEEIDSGKFSFSEFDESDMYRTIALYEYSDKSANYKITNHISNFIKRKSITIKSSFDMLLKK